MKKIIKIAALLCAVLLTLSMLGACSSEKPADAGETADTADDTADDTAGLTDFGWIKFTMPAGYEDAKESDSYVAIVKSDDSDCIMKFFDKYIFEGETVESIIAEKAEDDYYTAGDTFEMGGFKWYTLNFTFNDKDARTFCGQINDKYYAEITAFGLTQDDDAVKEVLGSLVVDESQLN